MTEIRKIYKKDIPDLLQNAALWNHSFLAISRHRLAAHYKNPTADDNDVVLLLAYSDEELVGYMGVFIDKIVLDGVENKIGWLSTWWVHPKTKGSGIGREILNTMYNAQDGKIGISQFTPSDKRVYDKSGYFTTLKENPGIKAVLRSNLAFLVPELYPKLKAFKFVFRIFDGLINIFVDVKQYFQKKNLAQKSHSVTLEYLNTIDAETQQLIEKYGANAISKKSPAFFEWLKAYHWVQEAPLLSLTQKGRYEFSMVDNSFNIYLVKVLKDNRPIGFLVLQKRNKMLKVLFAYYDAKAHAAEISDIIKLHCINLRITDLICYDAAICDNLQESGVFLYTKKRTKQSIISKAFGKENFDDVTVNFGDGDCSFA
jgi:hypothetical protein